MTTQEALNMTYTSTETEESLGRGADYRTTSEAPLNTEEDLLLALNNLYPEAYRAVWSPHVGENGRDGAKELQKKLTCSEGMKNILVYLVSQGGELKKKKPTLFNINSGEVIELGQLTAFMSGTVLHETEEEVEKIEQQEIPQVFEEEFSYSEESPGFLEEKFKTMMEKAVQEKKQNRKNVLVDESDASEMTIATDPRNYLQEDVKLRDLDVFSEMLNTEENVKAVEAAELARRAQQKSCNKQSPARARKRKVSPRTPPPTQEQQYSAAQWGQEQEILNQQVFFAFDSGYAALIKDYENALQQPHLRAQGCSLQQLQLGYFQVKSAYLANRQQYALQQQQPYFQRQQYQLLQQQQPYFQPQKYPPMQEKQQQPQQYPVNQPKASAPKKKNFKNLILRAERKMVVRADEEGRF